MFKFIYSFGVIFFGLALGVFVQNLINRGRVRLPISVPELRRLLQRMALLWLNPVAIIGAVWVVRIQDAELIAMPFIGLFAIFFGGVLALGAARLLGLTKRQTGAIFGCGSFTNLGSIGGLLCFVFIGEEAFALVPIYKLFEESFYYSVGFPIAKYFSGAEENHITVATRLKALVKDPFIMVTICSFIVGGLLNASGLRRPGFYGPVNALVVPLGAVLLLSSIGLALRFSRIGDYLKESLSVAAIKFLLVPICTSTLAWAFGFGAIENGLPLKVVIILSSMPVAFTALVPPSLYDLDLDLANSCWFVTTASLVVVLPVLLVVLHHV